jgi:bacterioferritin-associated ferredoxin
MIICSCNVLTDTKVKEYFKTRETKPSVGTVLKDLNCGPVCGTCANNIIELVREHYESLHR